MLAYRHTRAIPSNLSATMPSSCFVLPVVLAGERRLIVEGRNPGGQCGKGESGVQSEIRSIQHQQGNWQKRSGRKVFTANPPGTNSSVLFTITTRGENTGRVSLLQVLGTHFRRQAMLTACKAFCSRAYAASAKPRRSCPTSNTVWKRDMKTSPKIQRGPAEGKNEPSQHRGIICPSKS